MSGEGVQGGKGGGGQGWTGAGERGNCERGKGGRCIKYKVSSIKYEGWGGREVHQVQPAWARLALPIQRVLDTRRRPWLGMKYNAYTCSMISMRAQAVPAA